MSRVQTIVGVAVAVIVVGAVIGVRYALAMLSVPLPTFPPVEKTVWLTKQWSPDKSAFYHHASQGSSTFGVPYEWFVALERPVVSLSSPGLLADTDYLDRYGFIASDSTTNPLPIGFEHGGPMVDPTSGASWKNPGSDKALTMVGLTCAACHTGRMTYKGTSILIDGSGALIDVDSIRKAMGISLFLTRWAPFRFDRFAERLMGKDVSADAKAALKKQLDGVLDDVNKVHKLDNAIASQSVPEGIGRLDALNRIGNQIFSIGLNIPANYAPTDAPVRYPHIWDASWFDWVQYNSSIQQPMVRNAGEALGLGVQINLTGQPNELFRSNMNVETISTIEQSLRGPETSWQASHVTGLNSPKWEDAGLPPIDSDRAAKGAALYKTLCQGCHLPPVGSAEFFDPKYWQTFGPHALIVPVPKISEVGTDPAQAADLANRTVAAPASLGLNTTGFGRALGNLVGKSVTYWYDSQTPPTPPEQRNTHER